MHTQLANSNVVITAEQFNPSIVREMWLVRTGLVNEGEFVEGCVFADTIAHVRTQEFELMVIPQRAQFSMNVEPERQQQQICDKLGLLVARLPETPYRALGFNLAWHLAPETSVEDLSRRLFSVPDSPVHRFFDVPNGRFGSYLSKDTLGFRLKLTALPIFVDHPGQERTHLIAFSFNYHHDLPERGDAVPEILEMLHRWDDAVAESSQIVNSVRE
jgi:hypothetical protein